MVQNELVRNVLGVSEGGLERQVPLHFCREVCRDRKLGSQRCGEEAGARQEQPAAVGEHVPEVREEVSPVEEVLEGRFGRQLYHPIAELAHHVEVLLLELLYVARLAFQAVASGSVWKNLEVKQVGFYLEAELRMPAEGFCLGVEFEELNQLENRSFFESILVWF